MLRRRSTTNRRLAGPVALAGETMERRMLMSVSFAAGQPYSVGDSPASIAIADFSNRGIPDVATADSLSSTITLRLGSSDHSGSYTAVAHEDTTGYAPRRVLAGDVDNDGDVDLMGVAFNGGYSVFLNTITSGLADFTEQTPVNPGDTVRGAQLIDVTGDSKLDLVVLGVISGQQAFGVYAGVGNGTFAASPTVVPTDFNEINGLTIGDFDGDGTQDFAAFDEDSLGTDSIVVVTSPLGSAHTTYYSMGLSPGDMAVGDFNNDSKPDIALTASDGFSFHIHYMQNNGDGTFVDPHSAFSADFLHRNIKTQDIDGDGNLDVVGIVTDRFFVLQGQGDGTFASAATYVNAGEDPNDIGFGQLNGDGHVDVAVANTTDGTITVHLNESTPGIDGGGETPTVDLSAEFTKISLPSVFVPGDNGSATIALTNNGDTAVEGHVQVALYASTDGTLDDNDVQLDIGTALDNKAVRLAGDKSASLSAKFVVPATLANGTYFLIAKVTPLDIDGATEVTAASPESAEKVTAFGVLRDRNNVKYSYTDFDGTVVTLALSGPGTGIVDTSGGDVDISLEGTAGNSKFTVSTKGGDGRTVIGDLSAGFALGSVAGKTAGITGSATFADVKTIVLENFGGEATQSVLTINGATPVSVTLNSVIDVMVNSTAGLKSVKATAWTNTGFGGGSITAPYLSSLTVGGDFAADLFLSGAGASKGTALSSAKIGGSLSAATWSATNGNIGTITIGGSVATGWVGNFVGSVKTLTVKGSYAGNLAASNASTATFNSDVTAGSVRAGWYFGADNTPDTGDDTQAAGAITKLTVKGNVTSGKFYGGSNAASFPIAGGQIKTISLKGAVDADTRFVTANGPAKVKIQGVTVDTSTDDRFVFGLFA